MLLYKFLVSDADGGGRQIFADGFAIEGCFTNLDRAGDFCIKNADLALAGGFEHLDYEYRSPNYHFVYPFLLRLLYCTGLRISEALTLKVSSIDFDEHVLEIKQAKYNNSRLVPMSQSLFEALEKYMHQVGYEREETGFLFCSNRGTSYNASSILYQFKCILTKANISCTENGGLPRLHDLRHTFAVHALDVIVSQGMDTYAAIPYLAAYMGHRKIKCTECKRSKLLAKIINENGKNARQNNEVIQRESGKIYLSDSRFFSTVF